MKSQLIKRIEKALNNDYTICEKQGKFELHEVDMENHNYERKTLVKTFNSLQAIVDKFQVGDYIAYLERLEERKK